MDQRGINPGFPQTAPPPNYMSVPAKIELTSDGVRGRGGYSTAEDQTGYRPMKVPDMITLEPTAATNESTPQRETDQSEISQRVPETVEPISQVEPVEVPTIRRRPSQPQLGDEETSSAIADLDRRVKSLEQQVQRLKDVAVNRSGPGGTKQQGNNFWYVVTFAGWMMVPLIVVYMYRYRR